MFRTGTKNLTTSVGTYPYFDTLMTNTTYFDWLPTKDVIHESIMAMLDYESRIHLNQVLPPDERMSWRFPAEDILSHELTVAMKSLHYSLDSIHKADDYYPDDHTKRRQKKAQNFVSLLEKFREGRRERALLYHNRKFYCVVIGKLYSVLDEDSDVIDTCTPYFKKKIRGIAAELLPELLEIQPHESIRRYTTLAMGCAVAVF
jgi:hypothetical protein